MSALNHAFLRAYAKENAAARRSTATIAESVAVLPAPPPPHFVVVPIAKTSAAPVATPAANYEPTVSSSYASHASYFLPSGRTDGSDARRFPVVAKFAPAWEVDAFRWPTSCQLAWDAAGVEFGSLGDQLVVATQDRLRVLGVTSSTRHEGRTTLAMCLARAAADRDLRVMLLDADLDHPQLALALGVDVCHDWTEARGEALPLEETAVASRADRITLIPLVAGAAGRGRLLQLPVFAQFVEQLAAVCDLVVVDLPPLDSNCLPLAAPGKRSPLDATLVVRDVRHTSVGRLRDTLRRLESSGAGAVGVIENFV